MLALFLWVIPAQGSADNWLMVETRTVPNACEHPLICLPKSRLESRHLLNLSRKNRASFDSFLTSAASISGIPDTALAGLYPPDHTALHALEISPKLAPLRDHPGVYFDSQRLDDEEATKGFSEYIRNQLQAMGLKILTRKDWETTPGRPILSIRYAARLESAGCIVPFAIYMTIKEDVVLVRRPDTKIEATIWTSSRRQNLAHTNHSPTTALHELIDKFEKDWRKANRSG